VEEPPRSLSDGVYGAELERRIDEAAALIRERLAAVPQLAAPRVAMVLGSGLGGVVDLLDPEPRVVVPYRDIPHIPVGTVAGHAGELVGGVASGVPVLLLSGRAHAYEGWSQRQSTLLLRACLSLGIETLVLTPKGWKAGDLEAIL